ncbi:OmpA family protein [uncultured Flavobacterium sp.]|uniref:OmpA family protein n=1 Tax=uncultured Flavobacterium sp. TaxID=165435 RepID=UPI0030CA2CA0
MKTRIILSILFICSVSVYGQKSQLIDADKKFNSYAYIDAITIYEKVANKGYVSAEIFEKLGNAYYFNSNLNKAAYWYQKLIDLEKPLDPEYYFRFSHALKSIGDYEKSNIMFEKFRATNLTDSRGKKYRLENDYLNLIDKNSGHYTIENADSINSKYSDYGSAYFGDVLVFASARDTSKIFSRKHKWTNQSFTNLYQSNIKTNGNVAAATAFLKGVESKYNESSAVFTKDMQTMYFTRNNYIDGKKKKSSKKAVLLKIFKATFIDEKWQKIVEMPFNNNEYNVAHPALSPDEKTLYFASDMPGSIGASDLYKVSIDGQNYGKPINLGTKINTEARESFPFISDQNEIFFASDGHQGLGGFDVFVSKIEKNGSFNEVYNLGKPINSSNDDFAFLIDTETKRGFFSSNRPDGKGYDDIYKLKEIKPLVFNCTYILSGIVIDAISNKKLPNTALVLFDENFLEVQQTTANDLGSFIFNIACDKIYILRAIGSNGYSSNEKQISLSSKNSEVFVELPLNKNSIKVHENDDLATLLAFKIIYFDLDKSYIRKDAEIQLELILEILKSNPTMKIDIRSHTDCRQTEKYNLILSNKRAKSTMDWFVKNGIQKHRLSSKGFGESQLINGCTCEPTNYSTCTEEQHQQNRRSEFIVLKL